MGSCGCTKMFHPGMMRVVWTQGHRFVPATTSLLLRPQCRRVETSSLSSFVDLRLPSRLFPVRITTLVPAGYCRQIVSAIGLNEEQAAAVKTEANCVRVLAGPGSGKTLVLTCRIAHLIKKRGVNPSNMLCITFTNKAADELRQRLRKLLGEEISAKLTIGTFHSVCARVLREIATKEEVGVDKDFVIYDEQDAGRVVKAILEEILNNTEGNNSVKEELSSEELGSKKKKKQLSVPTKEVQETLDLIAGLKQFELKNFVLKRSQSSQVLKMPFKYTKIQHLAKRYQSALRTYNAVDFDDLIYLTIRLFYLKNEFWEKYQKRWSYVLADEFQDTDVAQYILVRKLCMNNKNLFVVGDVDQAIYGWRGADYKNMQDLGRHFPELTTLELRRNYRSSQSILTLASEIMNQSSRSNNSLKPLKLEPVKAGGALVTIAHFENSEEEAKYIHNKIRSLISRKQASYNSFGILYRTRNQLIIEEQPSHKDLGITAKARKSLLEFSELVSELVELSSSEDFTVGMLVQEILSRTKFLEHLEGSDENGEKRTGHIEEFQVLANKHGCGRPALAMFLESIALNSESEEVGKDGKKLDTVKLSTLHAAKGLEFDNVFISGLEEGTLPHVRGDVDEERRLFYVGVTRARNQLFITHRKQALVPDIGFRQTRVSSFLDLPKKLYKEEWHESDDSWKSSQSGNYRSVAGASR